MKQSAIKLNDKVAKAYENTPPKERKKLDDIVNRWLSNIFSRSTDPVKKLFNTMEEIGVEANEKGITPQALDEILEEIKEEMRHEKE
ncbi:MAG: hypothetical protein EA412_13160 [Chitinophagaceae bacterium]|nr:MAG: hypothetical protein EA412_13160 [Chitinophagaceae bacterium]